MAIYVNNLGSGDLPVSITNPQEGESLVWSDELGAYVNAPSSTSTEVIQDTVADMLEVDPDGSQVSLRLVSNYDDATGKLVFNVVADGCGLGGGGGSSALVVKENGTIIGTASTLNFVNSTVTLAGAIATITGNTGDVTTPEFINNAVIAYLTPNPFGYATENYVNQRLQGFNLEDLADTYVTGVTDGQTIIWNQANLRWQPGNVGSGGGSNYTLPTASTSVLGGVKVDGSTIIISNGVISAVGGSSSGINISDVATYLTTNGYTTQTYVNTQITNLVDGAPTLLNTLNELAAALNDNPNFATDVLLKTGGTMSGALTLSGAPTLDLQAATKKYVDDSISAIPAPTTNLNALTDVDTTGVATGQLLGWNGTSWVPTSNSGAKGDKGDTGTKGDTGNAGLSISAATVTLGGRLQLTLSDNTVVDAGSVAGIKSAAVNVSGELILTKQDNTTINAGSVIGPKGDKGNTGDKGDKGDKGDAGTVNVGTVTTAAAGGSASVTNSGTAATATLNFTIPRGDKGDTGNAATIAVGNVITGASGSAVSVTNTGTASAATLNFSIPQGAKGDTGNAGVGISSATVNGSGNLIITKTDSSTVDAGSVVGTKGDKGDTGNASTITLGAVATGAVGTDVLISNTGTANAATLNFTIPKGDTGLGIYSAVVNSSGNLILTLSDASTIDAGSTIGQRGEQGAKGDTGLSITSGAIQGDDLVLTKSDSTTINVGNVRGPKGDTGSKGDTGNTGTISVGSVTTGAVGSSVTVTNAGTSTAATLNFTIPQGAKGDTGTSYTVNNKVGSVQVYGIGNTTQAGYDLEVDLANKANKWTTARTFTLSGKVTGLTSFDGSGNITMTTALNAVTTNDITEGATNKYYTDTRARASLSSISDGNITSLISYDDSTGQIKYRANTSYIAEGGNLYFTNTRADTRADTRIAASSINALSDVDTVTAVPTNGQVLTWTGSAWTPSSVASGSGAISSVNAKTGIVVLNTDDVSEGSTNQYYTNTRWDTRLAAKTTDNLNQGTTNKYFSDTLARNALAAGTGISYNSSTGTFSLNASTDNVTEGSSNLYYTTSRFDTRLGQSNLNAFADVANTTPTNGQALAWNGSAWAPTTISAGSGGGSSSSGVFRAAVQVEYDASGNLASVSVLNGGISAVIATATSTVATVTFTFTGSVCAPLNTQVYAYQRTTNTYVATAVTSSFTAGRTLAGGGTSGSPSAFSAFDSAVNTMTIGLTKGITGASAGVGQTTHCVVQFLLSSV
jgi:collagen type VII alpha